MSSLVWWDITDTPDWPYLKFIFIYGHRKKSIGDMSGLLAAQSWPPRHTQNTLCCSWNSLSAAAAAIVAGSGNRTENRQQNSYENFRIQIWKKLNYTLYSIFRKIKINKWQRPAFGTRSWGKKTHQYNTPITEDPLITS